MEGISRRQLAKRLGVSEASIRKKISDGVLDGAVLPDGSLDGAKAARLASGTFTRGKAVPVQLMTARARHLRATVRKLADQVEELQSGHISTVEAHHVSDTLIHIVKRHLGGLSSIGDELAGLTESAAAQALTDALHQVYRDIAAELETAMVTMPMTAEKSDADELELDALTPAMLTARKVDLLATKMEIERAVDRGDLSAVAEIASAFVERLAVCKSLLNAIPNRLATFISVAFPTEVREAIASDVHYALKELEAHN